MNAPEIKYKLALKGMTFVGLDRKYGLPRGSCRMAVSTSHAKGELAIAENLGLHPKDIWSNRYDESGKRLRPQPKGAYDYKFDNKEEPKGGLSNA